MARISTYEIDTVIHADDNVIGTDPSSNNATRLYPVSSLAAFIRDGYTRIFDSEVSFGQDIPANGFLPAAYQTIPEPLTSTVTRPDVTLRVGLMPEFTYTHNLNTTSVVVTVFEDVMEYTFTSTDADNPQVGNSYTPRGFQDVTDDVVITIIDNNNVRVDFGLPRPITGRVIIIG